MKINSINNKILNNLIKEDFGLTAVTLGAGVFVGMIVQNMIEKYKNHYLTCNSIQDDIQKDRCILSILENMISELRSNSSKCESTDDPAQCKLDILMKIDRLIAKKARIMNHMNRVERQRNIRDSEL